MKKATPAGSDFTPTSLATGCIMIARFLKTRHLEFPAYLQAAVANAKAAGLSETDLKFAELLVKSIGGS